MKIYNPVAEEYNDDDGGVWEAVHASEWIFPVIIILAIFFNLLRFL